MRHSCCVYSDYVQLQLLDGTAVPNSEIKEGATSTLYGTAGQHQQDSLKTVTLVLSPQLKLTVPDSFAPSRWKGGDSPRRHFSGNCLSERETLLATGSLTLAAS